MTDERDPEFSGHSREVTQRYRAIGADEPPRALDEAILSAARQAVDKPHAPLVTPVGRHRWYYGVAAAAVVLLAVAVTLHIERQRPEEAYPPAAPAASDPEVKAPATRDVPAEKKVAPVPKPKPRFVPDPPPAAPPAPAAEPSTAAVTAQSRSADAAERRERVEAPAVLKLPPQPLYRGVPEVWLKEIARLRADGRHDEADRELDEFRKRHPGYRMTDEMRSTVERK